jgi:hypothetical protein
MTTIDNELQAMRQGHYERFARADRVHFIVEIDGRFEVHQHTPDGIAPPSTYNAGRQAVARVMQLMRTGPVAPQTWPEEVCIGFTQIEDEPA